jgi:magnesium-transporting ATPase (P-type)
MTKKIFLTPIVTLGIIFIVLGLRWMLVDEPWMLDKVANEERLNMTFDKLFNEEINQTLPGYLKQIYRFFGLWVSIIGIFIVSFAKTKFIENKSFARNLLICIGLMVISAQTMAYILIPSSPFIYLGWGSILMFLVSLWGYRKLS